ncbi:MAG: flagellar FliJ family protein [bacterium]|nr:flagellar FliJ family protein [bacterium]
MFKFSMQTALDVRGKQEKIQMKEMAQRLAVLQAIEAQMTAIQDQMDASASQLGQAKQAGQINLGDFKFLDQFRFKKRQELGRLEARRKEAAAATEKARLALVEAAKKRKTLEILSDREKDRYEKRLARLERQFLDETATNLFTMQQRS